MWDSHETPQRVGQFEVETTMICRTSTTPVCCSSWWWKLPERCWNTLKAIMWQSPNSHRRHIKLNIDLDVNIHWGPRYSEFGVTIADIWLAVGVQHVSGNNVVQYHWPNRYSSWIFSKTCSITSPRWLTGVMLPKFDDYTIIPHCTTILSWPLHGNRANVLLQPKQWSFTAMTCCFRVMMVYYRIL